MGRSPSGSAIQTRSSFDTDARRWAAVQARSASADGQFVYAVRSTKIYCRPVCSARLARRANVTFYPSGRDAERDNFRPCKRCKPDAEGRIPDGDLVKRVKSFLEGNPDSSDGGRGGPGEWGKMNLEEMARRTGISKWHFHRTFKRVVGVTPAEYVRSKQVTQEQRAAGGDGSVPGSTRGATPESTFGLDGILLDADFSSVDYMGGIWKESDLADFENFLSSIDDPGKEWPLAEERG